MVIGQESIRSTPSRIPQLVLLLLLAISAWIQFTVVSRTTVDGPLRADAGEYFTYAYNLRNNDVYSMSRVWADTGTAAEPRPDKIRTPGYPIFLNMVGSPDPSEEYVRRVTYFQAGLGVLSVLLVFWIARTFLTPGWALLPTLLTAVNPHLATISTYVLTESLFTFLLLASTLCLLKAVESRKRLAFLLCGALMALTSLVRPIAEFIPVVLVALAFATPRFRQLRTHALVGILGFAAVLSPWVLRNHSAPLNEVEGSLMVNSLAHGSYPDFRYENRPESFEFPYRFDPRIAEITKDVPSVLGHIAGKFRAEPFVYLRWYLIGKPLYFLAWGGVQADDVLIYQVTHSPYYEDTRFIAIREVTRFLHWPLMALAILGALLPWAFPRSVPLDEFPGIAVRLVSIIVIYAVLVHMIVAPFPRYSIPFRPLLFVLTTFAIRQVWLRFHRAY